MNVRIMIERLKSLFIQNDSGADRDGAQKLIRQGRLAIMAFFGALALWSLLAPIESAVVADGRLEVETKQKKIQHLEGGIISAVHVSENDVVEAGQLIAEFDATEARSQLASLDAQYADQYAKMLRFQQELVGNDEMPDTPLVETSDDLAASIKRSMSAHSAALKDRTTAQSTELRVLENRVEQLKRRRSGLVEQAAAVGRELELTRKEEAIVAALAEKGIEPPLVALDKARATAQLEARSSALSTEIAEADQAIGAAELEVMHKRDLFREQASREFADAQMRSAELWERRQAAADALKRTKVRAPRDGRVLALSLHTIGGVVKPGDDMMAIVPRGDALVIVAKIKPVDIDKVRPGSSARVRFTSLRGALSPEMHTTVLAVSADGLYEKQTDDVYFEAVLSVPPKAGDRHRGDFFGPGLPAEVYISTGSQRAISYLMRPLMDNVARTFKER
ncbi:MAG: HlyD family type I secretion periplasmic adaptor subunit [Pseudomonadota bacterium]